MASRSTVSLPIVKWSFFNCWSIFIENLGSPERVCGDESAVAVILLEDDNSVFNQFCVDCISGSVDGEDDENLDLDLILFVWRWRFSSL